MAMELQQLVQSERLRPEAIAARTRDIYKQVLRDSQHLDRGNFTAIHPGDVERLFDLYDVHFFGGGCRKVLGDAPMAFRLSKRMTQAGGQASRRELRDGSGKTIRSEYEIAVSTTLLFQTFDEDHRPVVMSGITCRDRLEALQRVVEHETVHLVELLLWAKSSCSASRFQSIANRFFAHTEHRHQLITPRERAFVKFGIKPGDQVSFPLDGQVVTGMVNRITKRATVLVEDERGEQYSNGKRYAKFYVPLGMLEPVEE